MNDDTNMGKRRNELFESVHAHAIEVIKGYGIPEDVADQVGAAIVDNLADNWGGQNICIPKDYSYKLAARDLEIWDDFTGNNHAELARKYNMTTRSIYKIIHRIRKNGDPNQQTLF